MYTVTIKCTENIDNLYKALIPEATKTKRFSVSMAKSKTLTILIAAQDATALKAITTSVTRLIGTAEKIYGKE